MSNFSAINGIFFLKSDLYFCNYAYLCLCNDGYSCFCYYRELWMDFV